MDYKLAEKLGVKAHKPFDKWAQKNPDAKILPSLEKLASIYAKLLRNRGLSPRVSVVVTESQGIAVECPPDLPDDEVDLAMKMLVTFDECASCGKHLMKPKRCGKCKITIYCNKECQLEHYSTHKKTCKKFVSA